MISPQGSSQVTAAGCIERWAMELEQQEFHNSNNVIGEVMDLHLNVI